MFSVLKILNFITFSSFSSTLLTPLYINDCHNMSQNFSNFNFESIYEIDDNNRTLIILNSEDASEGINNLNLSGIQVLNKSSINYQYNKNNINNAFECQHYFNGKQKWIPNVAFENNDIISPLYSQKIFDFDNYFLSFDSNELNNYIDDIEYINLSHNSEPFLYDLFSGFMTTEDFSTLKSAYSICNEATIPENEYKNIGMLNQLSSTNSIINSSFTNNYDLQGGSVSELNQESANNAKNQDKYINCFSSIYDDFSDKSVKFLLNNKNRKVEILSNYYLQNNNEFTYSFLGYFPEFCINSNNELYYYIYVFSAVYSSNYNNTYKFAYNEFKFWIPENQKFSITLPYSSKQIKYDLFEDSKSPIFNNVVKINSSITNPMLHLDNIKSQLDNIIIKIQNYINSNSNISKIGATSDNFSFSYDLNKIDPLSKNIDLQFHFNDEIANLIPIQNDILNQSYSSKYFSYDKNNHTFNIHVPIDISFEYNNDNLISNINIIPYDVACENIKYYSKEIECDYILNNNLINIVNNQLYTQADWLLMKKYGYKLTLAFNSENNLEYTWNQTFNNLNSQFIIINNPNWSVNLEINIDVNSFCLNLDNFVGNSNISLKKIIVEIPTDQKTQKAKWTKVSSLPFEDDKDYNINDLDSLSTYYGQYLTDDFFKLKIFDQEKIVSSVNSNILVDKYKVFINDIPFDCGNGILDFFNVYAQLCINNNFNNIFKIRVKQYDSTIVGETDINRYNKLIFGIDVQFQNRNKMININSSQSKIVWVDYKSPKPFLNPFGVGSYGYIAELNLVDNDRYQFNNLYNNYEINNHIFNNSGYDFSIRENISNGSMNVESNDIMEFITMRNNDNQYGFQYSLYNSTSNNIINIYNEFIKSYKPIFIDFWDSEPGQRLFKFLNSEDSRFNKNIINQLNYNQILDLWDYYINNSGLIIDNENIDISNFKFSNLKYNQIDVNKIILDIQNNISNTLNLDVKLGVDYLIEDFDGKNLEKATKFIDKLNELKTNSNSLVVFEINAINTSKLITGKNKISIEYINDNEIDTRISLLNVNLTDIIFNSEFDNGTHNFDEMFEGESKFDKVENLIINNIKEQLESILNLDNLEYNVDFQINFELNRVELDLNSGINYLLNLNNTKSSFDKQLIININAIGDKLKDNCSTSISNNSTYQYKFNDIPSIDNNNSSKSIPNWVWILLLGIGIILIIGIFIIIIVILKKKKNKI